MSGKGAGTDDSSALEKRKSSVNGDASMASDASGRSDRAVWRRTVESAAAGLTAADDAPVRIGFVQTSPDLRRWRVSLLRTPAAGEVLDAGKLIIRVETLASPDDAETNNREDMAIDFLNQADGDIMSTAPPRAGSAQQAGDVGGGSTRPAAEEEVLPEPEEAPSPERPRQEAEPSRE